METLHYSAPTTYSLSDRQRSLTEMTIHRQSIIPASKDTEKNTQSAFVFSNVLCTIIIHVFILDTTQNSGAL